jgi:predicted TIM-barrel fold metal-dependent hydrolase
MSDPRVDSSDRSEQSYSSSPLQLRMTRRAFLRSTAVTTAGTVIAAGPLVEAAEPSTRSLGRGALIDTNVTLSRWPFRRLPLDETAALIERLRHHGVSQAWAGSFDGLLHKNIGAVNDRLAEQCRQNGRGLLLPFGSINPKLPDWQDDLRRCHEQHKMPGLRLHPNYHRYKLDDSVFAKLLDHAGNHGLLIQLVLSMEDERTQHSLMQVPHVDAAPLLELLKTRPTLRLVLLNWFRAVKGDLLQKLAHSGRVWFDTATVEGVGGVGDLLKEAPLERVVFGSHAPLFYFESALLKLKESALSSAQSAAIRGGTAARLLSGAN